MTINTHTAKEKGELFHTVDENINSFSHYGKLKGRTTIWTNNLNIADKSKRKEINILKR